MNSTKMRVDFFYSHFLFCKGRVEIRYNRLLFKGRLYKLIKVQARILLPMII